MTIAALYIDPRGPYPSIDDVDCWDESRDARLYGGPHPVVAHPPCARWCRFAKANQTRYGLRVGDDGGCFASALVAARRYGGVLEHPAHSLAWRHYGLPRPRRGSWQGGPREWVTEVSQVAYGHVCRKRTWLLYAGPEPPPLDWSEPPCWVFIGGQLPNRSRVTHPGQRRLKRATSAEAIHTPPAFAALLVSLARKAGV